MLFGMFFMFVLIAAAAGALAWVIWRRLGEHLKDNPEAVAALTTHLFVPLLGRKQSDTEQDAAQ